MGGRANFWAHTGKPEARAAGAALAQAALERRKVCEQARAGHNGVISGPRSDPRPRGSLTRVADCNGRSLMPR